MKSEDKNDRAYHYIRNEIIQGKLKPLDTVDQTLIAKHLECSRLPVRQALLRLSLEGLVTYISNKGAKVTPLSMEDLVEIYSARISLESMLAKVGARKCELGQILELKRLLEAKKVAVEKRDSVQFLQLDELFHDVLYRASGYLYICSLTDQLRQRALRYLHVYASSRDHLQSSLDEHTQIVEAIQAKEYELVGELIKAHIEKGMEELAKEITSTDHLREAE
ncbi:GntR family transcriptional regulator [Paenibacillus zanthoxyli]|uniref:GntR family transcriptional regulator n=1 Tax=Paenibacillus zanthoxyli TaxID=369399 RepID=UPI00046FECAE|nr:GntR family transcriptional regulator [Paenibacillus zanthoxyli]